MFFLFCHVYRRGNRGYFKASLDVIDDELNPTSKTFESPSWLFKICFMEN